MVLPRLWGWMAKPDVDTSAPSAREIEVSLFGPGYGECVLVHLGEGQWMIVDSCVEQGSSSQPAFSGT